MVQIERKIRGKLYHQIEEMGNKKYEHIGFKDKAGKFGDMLAQLVPEVGMEQEAEITIRILSKKGGSKNGKDKQG